MAEREIPHYIYDNETKNKILNTATKLFALKGFGAVSMRDIAKAVGIKTSSIYHYYEGKDALFEEIMARFEKGYRNYFDWLTDLNRKADSLETLMDNMFNKEFTEMQDPIGCLGMSLAIKEQHNNESARRRVFGLLCEHSVNCMKKDFDRLIEKGIIPPSDTKMIATLFMFGVMAQNDLRLHEYAGIKPPLDSVEIYGYMKRMVTMALTYQNQKS